MRRKSWRRRSAYLGSVAALAVAALVAARMTTQVKAQGMKVASYPLWQKSDVALQTPAPVEAGRVAEPAEPQPAQPIFLEDPEGSAEAFREKNLAGAEEALAALKAEEETLRARLEKVQAGIARWQHLRNVLYPSNQVVPAGPHAMPGTEGAPPPAPGEIAPAESAAPPFDPSPTAPPPPQADSPPGPTQPAPG